METVVIIARLLHSWTRWLFVLVALATVVYFVLGLVQSWAWDKRANALLNAFGGIVGLQWLLGLVLLGAWGSMSGFNQRHFWEHLTVQTIAVIVANAHHGWRRRELADAARWRNGLIVVVVSLLLIIVGIAVLPVAIQWRFYIPS